MIVKPSSRPMMSSWEREMPRLVWKDFPHLEADVVPAALGVGQADPLTGSQRSPAYAWTSLVAAHPPARTLLEGAGPRRRW